MPKINLNTPLETRISSSDEVKKLILIVEDSPINQDLLTAILHHKGYLCQAVNNGAEAIEAIKASCFDLILMDCQMPVMGGLETTQKIRELEHEGYSVTPNGHRVLIIALTADTSAEQQKACLLAGMNDYISKPIILDTLVNKIEQCFQSSHSKEPHIPQINELSAHSWKNLSIDPNIIDITELYNRCVNDEKLMFSLLGKFHAISEESLERLHKSLSQKQALPASEIAHFFKSVAANLSAKTIHKQATALESACKREALEEAESLVSAMIESIRQFEAVIQKLPLIDEESHLSDTPE